MHQTEPENYSSQIRLELRTNGHTIALGQMGSDHVKLLRPSPLDLGRAEMILYVNGYPRLWEIDILPHPTGSLHIPIRRLS